MEQQLRELAMSVSSVLREQNTLDRMATNIRWMKDQRQTLFWRATAMFMVGLTFYYGTAASTSNTNITKLLWVLPTVMFGGSLTLILQDLINVRTIRKEVRTFIELEKACGSPASSAGTLQSSFLGDIRFVWIYLGLAVWTAGIIVHDYKVAWLKIFT